jgi:hypothetical protein
MQLAFGSSNPGNALPATALTGQLFSETIGVGNKRLMNIADDRAAL